MQEVLFKGLDKVGGPKRYFNNTGVNIIPTSHLMPSMRPIISVVILHGWKNHLQTTKLVNATVHGQCTSMQWLLAGAINAKAQCDIMVGFPTYRHIINAIHISIRQITFQRIYITNKQHNLIKQIEAKYLEISLYADWFMSKNLGKFLHLRLNGDILRQLSSTKYLGVHMDQHLTWNNHIDYE